MSERGRTASASGAGPSTVDNARSACCAEHLLWPNLCFSFAGDDTTTVRIGIARVFIALRGRPHRTGPFSLIAPARIQTATGSLRGCITKGQKRTKHGTEPTFRRGLKREQVIRIAGRGAV